MGNDKYDVRWSPFDPEWYQHAFDKPINVGDMADNQDEIISQGFELPDLDGSRSSIFRNEAVLNNSFNEDLLRESLKDIVMNGTSRLTASNHDETDYFQWVGYMSDMEVVSNTNYCQFVIPAETFINPNDRSAFKMSQYFRKWIKIEDIMNHWDIFKWHCLLFIDKRIYSEYEFRIDDREMTIRFKYYDFWIKQNYPVYIYKFNTNASYRVLISRELCVNQWDWKVPTTYINDQRIVNSENVIVAFNKISDSNIRKDGEDNVEVLGDNLEFLKITDGYIDLSDISNFNRAYILSEKHEWLWMSIFVPKYFHEYPIVLPTDVIYQPYEANLQPISTLNYDMVQHVKSKLKYTDEKHSPQLYIDVNEGLKYHHDSWKQLIRPVVLSDAFDSNYIEPYDRLLDSVNNLRDLTVAGADLIEKFRFYVKGYDSDETFKQYCEDLRKSMNDIRECMHTFLDNLMAEYDMEYESLYKRFTTVMEEIDEQGVEHDLFHTVAEYERPDRDFWMMISPLIWIPRGLADKYYIINVIHDMGDKTTIWEDRNKYIDKVRFNRPVDTTDFWTFEYDNDKQVWRPYPLAVSHHFPDVYVMKDPNEDTPTLNRIFKAFFFYSDTMNITTEAVDIKRPTQTWDEDVENYHIDQSAIYRDIFMEKFYWVGMRSIYKGILVTKNRWEVIEYVIDNPSYDRFNQLFLKTMDPYYKLGLATYLRSPEFGFPFDDAINKMEEAINTEFIGYSRITNFEVYLNKTWIPSYFDYVTKIIDEWEYEDRIVHRPRSTFDIYRLLPTMLSAQDEVYDTTRKLVDLIRWLVEKLNDEDYKVCVTNITDLKDLIDSMYGYISNAYDTTKNLDIHIFSIDDINAIASDLRNYLDHQILITNKFSDIYTDINDHNVHQIKRDMLDEVSDRIATIQNHIDTISSIVNDFDFNNFMSVLNELQTYFDHNKDNPDDHSLLGHINQFNDSWTAWVKTKRSNLFISSNQLFGFYDPEKLYEDEDIKTLMDMVSDVNNGLEDLKTTIGEFYEGFGYPVDEELYNKFDQSEYLLATLNINLDEFLLARSKLVDEYESMLQIFDNMGDLPNPTEFGFMNDMKSSFWDVIRYLSYIAGKNNKEEAEKSLSELNTHRLLWYRYLDTEKEVFEKLELLANPPIEILEILIKYRDIINAIIDYMDTVNIKYIPDPEWPTYSDVYRVTKVEVTSTGFENNPGEFIFAPKLGMYQIDSIGGNDKHVETISDPLYRNTTFRNPMMQYRPYDTITDGIGMGIFLKPIEIEHKTIINDSVIERIIIKINSALRMIDKNVNTFNPVGNNDLGYAVKDINTINDDWTLLIDRFWDHMTPTVKVYVDKLVKTLMMFIDPCNTLMDTRSNIKLSEFIRSYQDYIYDSYNYIRELDKQDQTFFYYDAIIRESYEEIIAFYGVGTSWKDGNELRNLLLESSRVIKFYWKKVLNDLPETEVTIHIASIKDKLISYIMDAITAIDELPVQMIDINAMIGRLTEKVDNIPEMTIDTWYRFKSPSIAVEGMEYRVGDIVEIVPTEEDFAEMVPLTVSDINVLWDTGIEPDDFDRDQNNPTNVRQLNEDEIDILWNDGYVDENNPGNQRMKLIAMKTSEIIKLWNGEHVSEDSDEVNMDEGSEEVILLQITDIDEFGRVKSLKPFMDYALPYKLSGVRETKARVGKGYGLRINCNSVEITIEDSSLLNDGDSAVPTHPKFDENDLMKFTFTNIHDLFINYEVFLGGKQISDFIVRHVDTDNPLYPEKMDIVYINANDVIDLQNSSIFIPSEHYFIYKIDNITIEDPGTGYCIDQNIYVDTENYALHMKVSDMKKGPHKGIEVATLADGGLLYERNDPGIEGAKVVTDTMNNLDDEFNVGYYDLITKDGFNKPLTKSYDPEEYSYTVKRFDNLPIDDRNLNFIYPNVDIKENYPQNGDPDYKWYQGSRIDNSYVSAEFADMVPLSVFELENLWKFGEEPLDFDRDQNNRSGVRQINNSEMNTMWNGESVSEDNPGRQRIGLVLMTVEEINKLWNGEDIVEGDDEPIDRNYSSEDTKIWNGIWNVVPPTHPFIPDIDRTPTVQPAKGEYQMIKSMMIHNTNELGEIITLTPLTVEEIDMIWNHNTEPEDVDHDQYNEIGVRQINDNEMVILWDDGDVDEDNPGNQRIKLKMISPLEIYTLWKNGEDILEDDSDPEDWVDGKIIRDVTSVFDFRVDSLENACMIAGDLVVEHFFDLPLHKEEYPEGGVGKRIIVEHDETNYGHRMMYRIRTFIAAGFFVYDLPEFADYAWNEFNVNWLDSDWIADYPTVMAQYPEAPWETSPSYRKVMNYINDHKLKNTFVPSLTGNTSFITDLTVDDISVYNWSTHEWEDLHNESRWQLITKHDDDNQEWGFTLRFLQRGNYSYDMRLYLNKTPYTQHKNAELKRNATMDISTVIHSEVSRLAINKSVSTGRHLRIRKLFPYEQKEVYRLGFAEDGEPLGYKMDFKLAPYIHYKNQLHLEDIKIYNISAGRFENVLDSTLFEVQFKDHKAATIGFETNTRINQVLIGSAGKSFINGVAWAWNPLHKIMIFGTVTTDYLTDGHLISFTPTHCPNPPKENISLEFEVFQTDEQSDVQKGVIIVEFITEKLEMHGDGYIHNVTNPLAPLPEEFRVVVLYDLIGIGEYQIILDNTPKTWEFIEPNWLMLPIFHVEGSQMPSDRLYVLTDNGRMPLINPSTKRPTLYTTYTDEGMDIMFMNLYRKYSKMNIHAVPYPMRSVYVQRKIPQHGYIDLAGKINKPLNKKYFEFWVNGRLLDEEVTIISPTRIFLHGLRSLKNLEIIEINRDPNEYFSDSFMEVDDTASRPYIKWNYNTYLDDALDGDLEQDNYTTEEQSYLLTPVWPQVDEDDPEYKNYPPNVDTENDVLLIIQDMDDFIDNALDNPLYQYMVLDPPTLEGRPIFDQGLVFEHYGLTPITDEMIVDMLNDEWEEELKNYPHLKEHFIISDDEWYGTAARLYDEFGIRVHTLNESAYNVHTDQILRINTKTKSNKIVKQTIAYDLT